VECGLLIGAAEPKVIFLALVFSARHDQKLVIQSLGLIERYLSKY
jgi:hypothetical protein